MHTKNYVIGDLQGCAHEAGLLLEQVAIDAGGPHMVFFVGDLINRGPESLAALRRVKAMQEAGSAEALLGNHDLHLLAVYSGVQSRSKSDTLDEILDAPDVDALMDWLRHRPMALSAGGCLLVHAGVLPQWSAARTLELGQEVETVLRSAHYRDFLREMYGNEPDHWDEALEGNQRLRCIVNALTRMRFCTPEGVMDFKEKESAGAPPGSGLLPWFALPGRQTAADTVVFGHWSALGLVMQDNLIGLDSGCVWGGKLTAACLETRALIQVTCPEHRPISNKQSPAVPNSLLRKGMQR
jgi:bis(5'-nucleosyl)-tetraphosphatase (symmetrical)